MSIHWARKVMNEKTAELVAAMPHPAMDALEISGKQWRWPRWRSFTSLDYPAFDICTNELEPERYDIVFAEQIMEHLKYPYRAVRNIYAGLRPNGYFMPTTPFFIRIHAYPTDCTRWTAEGMKYFLAECGFDEDKIQVGAWGNRDCVVANFQHWAEYEPGKHSLENEPNFPVVVWALAQK
jgi:SAM-dependent methyltransferase